jgi:hypothetical protein
VGFQTSAPVAGSGVSVHTYAFRSCAVVTIRFDCGAQSIDVIVLSCYGSCASGTMGRVTECGGAHLGERLGRRPLAPALRVDRDVVRVQAHRDLCGVVRQSTSQPSQARLTLAIGAERVRGYRGLRDRVHLRGRHGGLIAED